MDASKTLAEFRALVRAMKASLEEAETDHYVEVGTVLAAMVTTATGALADIKDSLREDARLSLNGSPGSVSLDGSDIGKVSITVPVPKLQMVKGTNAAVLKAVLGKDFDSYFTTKTTHTPVKGIADQVTALPAGTERDALLASLEEIDPTPRVSFRKV